ncbi:humanin-like 8 [Mesocricetus auratus]|uniref:Humanin-like 8 n=1 Tax=Mesocricetus auratus TaxID=10036 RepID=A0ABM2WWV4_MESAU|nr:humanin-like 8 [Mesocricetus auratus]
MAKRGFNCLLFPISEIDLPVKRRGYNNKTRRPYGALTV